MKTANGSRVPLVALLGAVLLMAAAGLFFWLRPGPEPDPEPQANSPTQEEEPFPPDPPPPDPATVLPADVRQSQKKLLTIGRALRPIHSWGHEVPNNFCDDAGKASLSWRVDLLPALGLRDLHNEFHLDEPWNSPHNHKLLAKIPEVFRPVRAGVPEGHTFYQGFVGAQGFFSDRGRPPTGGTFDLKRPKIRYHSLPGRSLQVEDGSERTFVIVEGGQAVPWTKPDDIPLDPAQPLSRLGGQFEDGFNALFASGRVVFFPRATPEVQVRAYATTHGKEKVDAPLPRACLTDGDYELPRPVHRGRPAEEWAKKLKSPYAAERTQALDALRELGPKARVAIPALDHLLDMSRADSQYGAAIELLGMLAPDAKEAIPVLLKHHRVGAARVLARLGKEIIPELIKALPNEVAIDALGRLGPDAADAVPHLVELLEPRKSGFGLPATVQALGRIGPAARPAVPGLVKLLQTKEWWFENVRPKAIRALGEIGPGAKEAVPVLTRMLRERPAGTIDRDAGGMRFEIPLRLELAAALARIDPADAAAVAILKEFLKVPNPPVQRRAALELARLLPDDREVARRLAEYLASGQIGVGEDSWEVGTIDLEEIEDFFLRLAAEAVRLGPVVREEVFAAARQTLLKRKPFWEARRHALLLVDTDRKAAVPVLIEALENPRLEVRLAAVDGLDRAGTAARRAIPALKVHLRTDDDDDLKASIVHLLRKLEAKK